MLRWGEAFGAYSRKDAQEGTYATDLLSSISNVIRCVQVWINQGDIILLSLRDFQDDKADVIVKYTADEARSCA